MYACERVCVTMCGFYVFVLLITTIDTRYDTTAYMCAHVRRCVAVYASTCVACGYICIDMRVYVYVFVCVCLWLSLSAYKCVMTMCARV